MLDGGAESSGCPNWAGQSREACRRTESLSRGPQAGQVGATEGRERTEAESPRRAMQVLLQTSDCIQKARGSQEKMLSLLGTTGWDGCFIKVTEVNQGEEGRQDKTGGRLEGYCSHAGKSRSARTKTEASGRRGQTGGWTAWGWEKAAIRTPGGEGATLRTGQARPEGRQSHSPGRKRWLRVRILPCPAERKEARDPHEKEASAP